MHPNPLLPLPRIAQIIPTIALSISFPLIVQLAFPQIASAQISNELFRETFQNSVLDNPGNNYRITSSIGQGATNNPIFSQSVCLTAKTIINVITATDPVPGCAPGLTGLPIGGDTPGRGALRLTSNRVAYQALGPNNQPRPLSEQGERGSFIIDRSFARNQGLVIEFDFFIYNGRGNGTPPGADGISFFILDGAEANPRPGAFGGSLGYAQATNAGGGTDDGVTQGFIGVGFDVFGNFSAATEGRQGGSGFSPDSIVLRGSGNGTNGYNFINRVQSNTIIGTGLDDATTIGNGQEKLRSQGIQGRHARITISKDGFLTVELSTVTGDNVPNRPYQTVFNNLNLNQGSPLNQAGQIAAIPATFKFGFAASTGFSTAIHEIQNFIITTPTDPIRNFRLVKRVTAVIRQGIRTEFNQFRDDPTTTNDNAAGWTQPGARPVGEINVNAAFAVQSNDEVEYTIYYLADGDSGTIADAGICDPIPTNSTFVPNSNQISRNNSTPVLEGTFFNKLQPIPIPTACPAGNNPNGAILYSLGNLSTTAGQNFGFTRFRTRVNGN
jgi:hypothetical protein